MPHLYVHDHLDMLSQCLLQSGRFGINVRTGNHVLHTMTESRAIFDKKFPTFQNFPKTNSRWQSLSIYRSCDIGFAIASSGVQNTSYNKVKTKRQNARSNQTNAECILFPLIHLDSVCSSC